LFRCWWLGYQISSSVWPVLHRGSPPSTSPTNRIWVWRLGLNWLSMLLLFVISHSLTHRRTQDTLDHLIKQCQGGKGTTSVIALHFSLTF
jgi:hypothetical protein